MTPIDQSPFDEATAVRRLGQGQFETTLDRRFAFIAGGGSAPPAVNGGALMAAVLRAVLAESPHPHPVATSVHFLRVARLGPARITLTWLRRGGTAATVRAALEQDGAVILDTTVTTGTVPASPFSLINEGGSDSGRLTWAGPPPDFPAAADCVELAPWRGSATPDGSEGYAANVRLLFDPATTGWRRREPSGCPEMRAYVSLRAERDPDVYLLALAVDALPPVVFGLGATGWSPTVELTWHMRAVPAPGPLRVSVTGRQVSGGWFDEDAEVWDAAGTLVAQGRQLARVGRGAVREVPAR